MSKDSNLHIGLRIKKLIDERNLTAYVVSQGSGVKQPNLSRLLTGETKRPSAENIKLLANYFQVSEQYLLTGKDDTKQENTDMNMFGHYYRSSKTGKQLPVIITVKKLTLLNFCTPFGERSGIVRNNVMILGTPGTVGRITTIRVGAVNI